MKKVHLIPNAITALGLSCGLFVIFRVTIADVSFEALDILKTSTIFLLLAAFADVLDGLIARRMHAQSDFGLEFDSLADAVTFGVAPAVIVLKTLSIDLELPLGLFIFSSALIFSLCAILRLVRFNVSGHEDQKILEDFPPKKKHFTGLPVPAAALALVSANLFLFPQKIRLMEMHNKQMENFFAFLDVPNSFRGPILSFVMLILGYFMVSRWKFPSLNGLNFKVPRFRLALTTVFLALFLLYGILYHFSFVFFFLIWTYILVAWVLSIIRLLAGKKSKTLEDFEPDPED